ncbi:MAG: helix-hairpin-helix domain-containing protein [Firmicutes bacterium]|nr:helix-hairpin-helix domain-containing protein [Bacillota bacterium]
MQKHTWAKCKPNIEELVLLAREKMADSGLVIEKRQAAVIVLLLIFIVSGSLLLYMKSKPRPVAVSKAVDKPEQTSKRDLPAKVEDACMLYIHVAGAVVNPGVYRLKEGSRVIDAVNAAGGGLDSADEGALNLAAKVFDGQKIYMPKKGEVPQQTISLQAGADGSTGDAKINLNTATLEQLDALPGIGQVTATRIIEYRNKRGPFKRVDDLKEIDGIGNKKFDQIKDRLCVE